MANETTLSFAGIESLHISYRNSAGAMNGYSNLTATNTNTNSGMRRLKFVQSVPNPSPNRVLVRSKGDNGYGRGFSFQGQPAEGEVHMGRIDVAAAMTMMGATYYDLGNWRFGIEGVSLPTIPDLMALTIADAGAEDSGSTGAGYKMRLYPNVQMIPLGEAEQTFQAEGIYRYQMIVNPFTVLPWGAAFSSSNFTVADGLSLFLYSPYRVMIHAWVGNNAATGPTLDYTPISTTYIKSFNADTPAALTVSSVDTSTKVVTLSAAPASGVLTDTIYGFSRYS